MANKVGITETILRDAHQSLIATRMTTEEMLPIVEKLDNIGYHSLEAWGGATFDACLRFLNEDPWVRLRKIKERAKKSSYEGIENIIDAIGKARERLHSNVNFDLVMELLFMTIREN